MSNNPDDILRAKVNMETSRIAWKELQKFFASGAAVEVSAQLDLVEVAMQMHHDNKAQFAQWMQAGLVGKVTDEQARAWIATDAEVWARAWIATDAEVWAVVVSPWVLVQEIRETTTQ
jgi:hypothetical protein